MGKRDNLKHDVSYFIFACIHLNHCGLLNTATPQPVSICKSTFPCNLRTTAITELFRQNRNAYRLSIHTENNFNTCLGHSYRILRTWNSKQNQHERINKYKHPPITFLFLPQHFFVYKTPTIRANLRTFF